jgi:hypothetical protein
VETPKQLADRVGLRERQIKRLIDAGQLESVRIGCRDYIPKSAWPRFLEEAKRSKVCHAEIKAPGSDGSLSGPVTTSHGQKAAAAASARLARQTANKLKSSSPNGSNSEEDVTAQVIRLRS